MKITLTDAPWDSAGNLVVYPGCDAGDDWNGGGYDWKANGPFTARLHLVGTTRGHSAARFQWSTDHGIRMDMFMADMTRLIQATARTIEPGGFVEGEWIVVKRGANYGVTPFLEGDTYPEDLPF